MNSPENEHPQNHRLETPIMMADAALLGIELENWNIRAARPSEPEVTPEQIQYLADILRRTADNTEKPTK